MDALSDQLTIGLLAQLVKKCRSRGSNPVQAWTGF